MKKLLAGALGISLITGVLLWNTLETAPPKELTKVVAPPQKTEQVSTAQTTLTPVNNVIVETALSIKLLQAPASNILIFNVPVLPETTQALLEIFNTLDGDVFLVLDSPGGSVVDGAKIIDYIENSGKNIYTVCDNFCASMAFQIFQHGKQRLMSERAILMAHPASGGTQGTIENMKAVTDMFKLYVDRMDAYTAKRAKIDYVKFKAMVGDNLWLETPEAIKMNLADSAVFLKAKASLLGGNDNVQNLKQILQKRGILTPKMMEVKGYEFIVPAK